MGIPRRIRFREVEEDQARRPDDFYVFTSSDCMGLLAEMDNGCQGCHYQSHDEG